ncbi:MAG TPA: branched-chain amino acid ABC transporter permease [Anaeromyxobacter sp.]|nr:branched-chain amino acid ABC transporter permease [Anaeromyxobacter sp.]
MTEFLQHLVNGVSLGTIYALIALGYTMVYGVLKLINFAHGDVYMVGAFMGYYLAGFWRLGGAASAGGGATPGSVVRAFLITAASMVVCGFLGYVIERFAYRPLRDRPRLTALITAIGVSFLLEFGFQLNFRGSNFPPGPTPRIFPTLFEGHDTGWLSALGVNLYTTDLLTLGVAILLMVLLQWIVYRTKFGTAMRAVSFDHQVAGLMGIPVNRIISWTFVLGSALAAAAGILFAVTRPRIDPLMGLMFGLKAFVAAVLGGIGSVPGAMVGGMVLGLSEEFVAGYLLSSYRDAIAFGILILVLVLRPSGLFGRTTVEKV